MFKTIQNQELKNTITEIKISVEGLNNGTSKMEKTKKKQ